ncbi:Uncharacterised protein [Mycobacteroides abscessus subsp. abscessus]|nr:Uncharacterised protein [Mycobacteroides abscessus subsp. abscessus]
MVLELFDPAKHAELYNKDPRSPLVRHYSLEAIWSEVQKELLRTEMYARRTLGRVNPAAICYPESFRQVTQETSYGRFLFNAGFARLFWAVGAAGGGKGQLGEHLDTFLVRAAQWTVTELLAQRVHRLLDGEFHSITASSANSRIVHMQSRLWWASSIVCRSLVRHAGIGSLPESIVDELVAYIETSNTMGMRDSWPEPVVSDETRQVIDACTIPAGVLAGQPLGALFYSRNNLSLNEGGVTSVDFETHPFISVDGTIVPASLTVLRGFLHAMILPFLVRKIGDKAAVCFEKVSCDLLGRIFTQPGCEILHDPKIVSGGSELQTDLIARERSTIIVGEAKSSRDSPRPGDTRHRYIEHVGYALEQINERIEAIESGALIRSGRRMTDTSTLTDIRGLGIVSHSYGGAIWNSSQLAAASRTGPKRPVITLHDLALITHTLRDPAELRAYLDFRGWLFDVPNAEALEELDILAVFLERADEYMAIQNERRASLPKSIWTLVPPRIVPPNIEYQMTPPAQLNSWRRTLAGLQTIDFPFHLGRPPQWFGG